MADSNTVQYEIQVISGRYIRKNIFEDYVNARMARFGSDWRCNWARDNKISFTALQNLTNEELDYLQQQSQQAIAPPNQSLFVE